MNSTKSDFDVVIIGGGPAGMSAVLWCDELGLTSCLIERNANLGGQLHWIYNSIRNHIGSVFENGADCLDHFSGSLLGRQFECVTGSSVVRIGIPKLLVQLSDGAAIAGKAVVVASGVRRRKLGVSGESEFFGKGILESGVKFRTHVQGRNVAVIGGGDAALENALILAEHADSVYLIHRRNQFNAKEEFVESVRSNSKIEIVPPSIVQSFGGNAELQFIDLRQIDGRETRIAVDNAIVRIGVEPNTEFVPELVATEGDRYLKVDKECRTSVSGIFAVGDVANGIAPTISTAVGMAATAIKSIAKMIRENE